MNSSISLWQLGVLCIYFLLFFGTAVGLFIWRARRHGGRPPVKFKLLRAPGETLRRKLAEFDENLLFLTGGAAIAPFAASLAVFAAMRLWFIPTTEIQFRIWVGALIAPFVVTLVVSMRWLMSQLRRYRDLRLGYLGEREVGEQLLPLSASGYRVFHDVPADGERKAFNLDHVVVGRTGIVVVETKTRRKGRARPGMKDHVVTYDGKQLIWPWGEDRHGLNQVVAEADWLRKFVQQRTGIEASVRPILALPGWWVDSAAHGPVMVANSKMVAGLIQRSAAVLSEQQVDLVSRQLDQRCRDVED
jgi:hypothetical protein